MLRSMTAYGRSVVESPIGRISVEIQSVNKRFFEVFLNSPRNLLRFEQDMRKWVSRALFRGQVSVSVSVQFSEGEGELVLPNLALAHRLKNAWDFLASELNISPPEDYCRLLSYEKSIMAFEEQIQDEEGMRKLLQQAFDEALQIVVEARKAEGRETAADISSRVENISNFALEIAEASTNSSMRYRERLLANLEEVLPGAVENEERILREIAVYSDKVDIAEELQRLKMHIGKFASLMQQDKPLGKSLEFLVQEMHREVNTIGSKSIELSISHNVVDIKSELEKVREQLQNVE